LVVGSSGSGKSTLLRCIGGLVPHFSGGVLSGNLRVHGLDPVSEGPGVMSRHIGFVFQDPETQAVMERVEDEIAFGLEQAGLPRDEMRVRVEEVLDLLDLAPLRDRALETLSGGERQRVSIAAALALRPRVLVLDEPTSQLDPQSAEDVLRALVRLNEDLGLTIVIAEHRLERVLPFADLLVFLDDKQPGALAGAPADLARQLPLRSALVQIAEALDWNPTPLTIKAGLVFSRKMPKPPTPPILAAQPAMPLVQPFLELRAAHAAYGTSIVLRDVSLAVRPGEIVALLGRSGVGKSTLLKTLVGLIRLQRGKALVAGQDTAGREIAEICRQVAYLPQDPNALLFAETVREELVITLRNHGLAVPSVATERQAYPPDILLERLGLLDKALAYPRDLSAGERQRVALGAVMVTRPGALLLDEPTRGLDYVAKQSLAQLLHGWQAEGAAMIIVTHDVEFAATIATRALLLARGEIIADGPIGQVLGASPLFAPQTARLFPGTGWLTPDQALLALRTRDG
jgi:energy-coupling factor transport system ATP-binding protein